MHHGDCLGADALFHETVQQVCPEARIVIHPPNKDKYRAYCVGHVYRQERDYLLRNHDIIDDSDVMIAVPKEMQEPTQKRGGGTWATIRHTWKKHKPLYILLPDGTVEHSQ